MPQVAVCARKAVRHSYRSVLALGGILAMILAGHRLRLRAGSATAQERGPAACPRLCLCNV